MDAIELQILPSEAGERLDRVLAARKLGHSRATLQRWMEQGRVTVGGAPASPKHKARAGDDVRIEPAPPPPSDAEPEDIALHILFEDEHLLVVHKPAGMVVHPAAGHPSGTLVNAILHHTQVARGEDGRRPGIVHRLDKDTSGVMVVARTDAAREGLSGLFARHDIERIYEAICLGEPPERIKIDAMIGRHPVDRKRFSTRAHSGKRAVTHVSRLTLLRGASLVRCQLETGRTHQIRVHLSDLGHPLLGDPVYGRLPAAEPARSAARALQRQALHARVLGFVHPISGEALHFDVPPPADFQAALAALALA